MKKGFCFFILLMGAFSFGLAQTKTPVAGSSLPSSSEQVAAINAIRNNPIYIFNAKYRKSIYQMNHDIGLGKLTQAQGQSLKEQLRAIRVQELQFFKLNGNRQLTSEQLTQLNQSLAQISASL
jgi:ATP:corrinoid adenosyltransferase